MTHEEEEVLQVDIDRKREDYKSLCSAVTWDTKNLLRSIMACLVAMVLALHLGEFFARIKLLGSGEFSIGLAYIMSYILVMPVVYRGIAGKIYIPYLYDRTFIGKKLVTVDEDGFHEESPISSEFIHWSAITKIQKSNKLIMYFLTPRQASVVPLRNFKNKNQADHFYRKSLIYWQAALDRQPQEKSEEF